MKKFVKLVEISYIYILFFRKKKQGKDQEASGKKENESFDLLFFLSEEHSPNFSFPLFGTLISCF
jgi:hypothetical protein